MNDGSNEDSSEGSSTSPTKGENNKNKVQEEQANSHLCNKDNQAQGQ